MPIQPSDLVVDASAIAALFDAYNAAVAADSSAQSNAATSAANVQAKKTAMDNGLAKLIADAQSLVVP